MKISDDILLTIPIYKCVKTVRAFRIKDVKTNDDKKTITIFPEDSDLKEVILPLDWLLSFNPLSGGYFVVYDDGFCAYLPMRNFEEDYRKIKEE